MTSVPTSSGVSRRRIRALARAVAIWWALLAAAGTAAAQTAVTLNNSSYTFDNSGQSGPHTQAMGTLTVAGATASGPSGRNTVTLVRSQPYPVTLSFSGFSAGASENGRAINFVLGGTPGVNGVDSRIVLATQTEYRFRSINAAYFNGGEFAVYDMAGGGGANGFVRGIRYGIDANSRTSAAGATFASNAVANGATIFSQEVTGPISAQTTLTIGSTSNSAESGTLRIVGPSNITLASGATLTVGNAGNGGSFGVLKTGGGTAVIGGGTGFGVNGGVQSTWRVDAIDDVLVIDTPLTGWSGATRFFIDGQGTLSLRRNIAWANDHRNNMQISAGTLEIGGSAQHTRDNTGGNATWFTLGASTATFHYASTNTASTNGAPISGAGQVLVSNGRITFQGTRANTYTGPTTVSGGTLGLNYASAVSRITDTAQLRLGGGTVELIDGTYTEVVGSTALVGGLGRIIRSSGTSVLRLNTVTPGTGFVDFGAGGIAQVDNANTNGILGPWATVAGSDWAVNSTGAGDGPVTAYTGYTDIDARGSTLPDAAAANVRISGDGTSGPIALAAPTTTVYTLLQGNGTTAATIDTAAGTLAVSGVLVGSGRQPLTIGVAAGDGSLRSGDSTANLALTNLGSAGPLTVNAPIVANGGAGLVTTGDVVLNGASTYTGPTAVNAGTLTLGVASVPGTSGAVGLDSALTLADSAGATLALAGFDTRAATLSGGGSRGGNVLLGAARLTLTGAGTADAYAGAISGDGGVTLAGGAQTFSGQNTYAGDTILSGGILRLGAATTGAVGAVSAGPVGTGTVVFAGGGLSSDGSAARTVNNPVVFTGAGTLGDASRSGLVALAAPVDLGSDARTLTVASTAELRGVVGGLGGIVKEGAARLSLAAANTYTGGTTINAGTLQIGAGGTTGALSPQSAIGGASGGVLAFNRADTLTQGSDFAATIGGAIGLATLGTGTVVLDGTNTYTGPTTITAGTLQIGAGGTSGRLSPASAISGSSGAVLAFNRSDTLTQGSDFGASVGGTLGVTTLGGGTVVLTSANSYTGPTRISLGTLQIGAGGTSGSLAPASTIVNDGTLTFNRSDTLTQGSDFADAITGLGSIVQAGSGTTVLGSVNTYVGSTTVTGGTLAIGAAGSIPATSGVVVAGGTFRYDNATTALPQTVSFSGSGGTIAGTGLIGVDLVISAGNTLSPGASPGTLSQVGNQTWASGGNYNWQLFDAASPAGTGSDWMTVSGFLIVEPGFNVNLWSLGGIGPDVTGDAANFDPDVAGHWVIATAGFDIVGGENLATANVFTSARNGTGGFTNPLPPGGSFTLVRGGNVGTTTSNDVVLLYTVPEPAAVVLAGIGLGAGLLAGCRAHRRRWRPTAR